MTEYAIHLPKPHPKQNQFIVDKSKRKVCRAGRRSGKTVGVSIKAVRDFLSSSRILYAAPTQEQVERFWVTVIKALQEPIDSGIIYKNESRHLLEIPGTETRIRAKTAWNADTLRGDYADELILDEWQLMDEDAWGLVGAPMLLDNNGNATFLYTPPSFHSRSVTKARDPQHAAKLFKRAENDKTDRWKTFHFTSLDNPHISRQALEDITQDMTSAAVRMEIMAEDMDEAPGALWKRSDIDDTRVTKHPDLVRILVGVDPSATSGGDEAGVITAGKDADDHGYVIADDSLQGSPNTWAKAAVSAYHKHQADGIVAESNQGGEMVQETINTVDPTVPVTLVHASRGKATRAEPVAARYEQGKIHHCGDYPILENEMCLWIPGQASPNRMDSLAWVISALFNIGELFVA